MIMEDMKQLGCF